MKRIRKHIAHRTDLFGRKPLFVYLADSAIEPARRLAFVPTLAHFVMSFADLYRFFLVEKDATGRYEALVNAHLSEDANHWKWFLKDLGTTGLDPEMHFSDALRFIWSDASAKTRALTYGICKLSGGLSPLEKLVMVQCIEATGSVALGSVAHAGRDFASKSGRKLLYFGAHHVDTESAHTLEQPDVRDSLDDAVLEEDEVTRCLAIIDEAFGYFEAFADEVFEATRGPVFFARA
jgi:hypothetical protein